MSTDYSRLFDLSGRVAVVTGGLGILGRHFCQALSAHGAHVAVLDLEKSSCSHFADELSSTYDTKTLGINCDVSDPTSINLAIGYVESQLGPVDILHNNAASKSSDLESFLQPLESYDPQTWQEVMQVNLDGMFLVAKDVGSRMSQRGKGSIIQTSSIYGVIAPDPRIYQDSLYNGQPISSPAVYSASKAGVIGLTRYLSAYWGSSNIRVNTLTPGGVESGQNDVFKKQYSARVPLDRMGRPDEMTGALIFLASDASSYITGQNIIVDGGLTAW